MFKVGEQVVFKTGYGPFMVVTKETHPEVGSVL